MSETLEKWTWSPLTRTLLFNQLDKHSQSSLPWHGKVNRWMVQQGSRYLFIVVFTLIQALTFICLTLRYCSDDFLTGPRTDYGVAYPFVRAAASLLNLNFAIFFCSLCQAITTWMRTTFLDRIVPFRKTIMLLHKMAAGAILIFAWIHAVAQWSSTGQHAIQSGLGLKGFFGLNFGTWTGWSGNITLIVLTLIVVNTLWRSRLVGPDLPCVQQLHYLLFNILWSVHGGFCSSNIPSSESYYGIGIVDLFYIIGACISIADGFLMEVCAKHNTFISKVIQHPSDVVEIQFKKEYPMVGAGQYILFCCPELNFWNYRYLGLTSAPEEDYISVHIRYLDPYTKTLANIMGCKFNALRGNVDASTVIGLGRSPANFEVDPAIKRILPSISTYGPFGSHGNHVFDNEIAIMVGDGTGVVTFASILKSIWYRMTYSQKGIRLRKAYFFGVLEDFVGYEWFRRLLMAIEAHDIDCNIEIHTYLTAATDTQDDSMTVFDSIDAPRYGISGLREPTMYGQPNWDAVFQSIRQLHGPGKAGIFISGPTNLKHQAHIASKVYSELDFKYIWYGDDF